MTTMTTLRNTVTTLAFVACLLSATVPAAHAVEPGTGRQIIKNGAIGAGAGAILGGVSKEGSALRGAGYGALSGVGTAILDKSTTLNSRPMVKDTLKGAVVGAGSSAALGKNSLKGAGIGAGAGAAWGWLRKQ